MADQMPRPVRPWKRHLPDLALLFFLLVVGGQLWLNGALVKQTLAEGARREALPGALHPLSPEEDQGPDFGPLKVPEGEYLLLGDHRGNSADSRMWGLLPRAKLLGRAVAVVFSAREGLSGTEHLWLPLTPDSEDPRLLEPRRH